MIGIVYEIQIGPYKQIGSTHNLEERKYHHLNLLVKNKHYNQFLQRVYNKYNTFEIVELCRFPTREEGYKKEQEMLNQFYGQPCYTMEHPMAVGGSRPGKEHPNFGKKRPEHSQFLKDNPDKSGLRYKRTEEHLKQLRKKQLNKVVCKDLKGNTFVVTKEEYDRRKDLVGISSGIIKPNARKHIKCLEDGKEFHGIVECGKYYGVPPGQISEQLKGKREHVGLKKYEKGLHFNLVIPK